MSDEPTAGPGPGPRSRNNLVALGAAAVLTVYGAGYLRTQEAAAALEADEIERPAALRDPGAPASPVPGAPGEPPAPDGSTGSSASGAEDVGLRDGRFTGLGRSRHGNIEATLEITDGLIVSATITSCKTLYPCSRIDEIVPQVVERQDSWVDNVSGATVSVTAVYRAVVQALKQAQ